MALCFSLKVVKNNKTILNYSLEELLNHSSSQVRVNAEVEDLRSQLSRLNIRNKELELQNSGRSNDHARMLKQVTPSTMLKHIGQLGK